MCTIIINQFNLLYFFLAPIHSVLCPMMAVPLEESVEMIYWNAMVAVRPVDFVAHNIFSSSNFCGCFCAFDVHWISYFMSFWLNGRRLIGQWFAATRNMITIEARARSIENLIHFREVYRNHSQWNANTDQKHIYLPLNMIWLRHVNETLTLMRTYCSRMVQRCQSLFRVKNKHTKH